MADAAHAQLVECNSSDSDSRGSARSTGPSNAIQGAPSLPSAGRAPGTRVLLTFHVNCDPLHHLFASIAAAMAGSRAFFRHDGQLLFSESRGPQMVKARALPALLSRFVELRFVRLHLSGEGELLGYGLLDVGLARAFLGCPELALLPEWSGPDPKAPHAPAPVPIGQVKFSDILRAAGTHPQATEPVTATTWVERLEQTGFGYLLKDEGADRTERGKATWLAKVFARSLHQPIELPSGVLELIRQYPRGPHAKPHYQFVAPTLGEKASPKCRQ